MQWAQGRHGPETSLGVRCDSTGRLAGRATNEKKKVPGVFPLPGSTLTSQNSLSVPSTQGQLSPDSGVAGLYNYYCLHALSSNNHIVLLLTHIFIYYTLIFSEKIFKSHH